MLDEKKHLKFEEKKLLLKYHFESDMDLDKLSSEFETSKSNIYNWLRKIDYNYDNVNRLKVNKSLKERTSRIKSELSDEIKV